ncbi:hypothetical protein, partial [Metarhizobium album]|uniref:hypothetical protein n=1 Tax=Metarhizobium album TaxID=2182425 RepID=UPI0010576189
MTDAITDEMVEAAWRACPVGSFDRHVVRGMLDAAFFLARTPAPQEQMTGFELPADVIESLLKVGLVEWGQTFCQSDEKHIEDYRDTLR